MDIILGNNLFDSSKGISYKIGAYLGKGAFAKCYELLDVNNVHFAAKIIPKSDPKAITNKSKIQQEISIHKNLKHKNIVEFINYFQDEKNIFIVLEYCGCQSLAELSKRRKTLLVPETRYFTKQIAEACEYLHENLIIHRDLKLANIFLNSKLIVKLGDFGFSTQLDYDAEKKKTLCGTPNYIAPEILLRGGHSFEVDVWAFGVIIYTLIVGKPPFETDNIEDTYRKITTISYEIPDELDDDIKEIVSSTLRKEANSRPTMKTLLQMDFFKEFIPSKLPASILSYPPRFKLSNETVEQRKNIIKNDDNYCNLKLLQKQIMEMLENIKIIKVTGKNKKPFDLMRESENPKLAPIFWISKWCDATTEYGLFYMLNDNSTGAHYNDKSKLVLASNEINLQYVEKSNTEHFFTIDHCPTNLQKKIKLMYSYKEYMSQNLVTAGGDLINSEQDSMIRLPCIQKFYRESICVGFLLSNDTLQVNFYEDHVKLVLCPFMGSVMIIDENSNIKTFKLTSLRDNGITSSLLKKFQFILSIIEKTVVVK